MGFKVSIGSTPSGVDAYNLFPDPFIQDPSVVYVTSTSAAAPPPTGGYPGSYIVDSSSTLPWLLSSSRTVSGARPEDPILTLDSTSQITARVELAVFDPNGATVQLGIVPLSNLSSFYPLASVFAKDITSSEIALDRVSPPAQVIGVPSVLALRFSTPPAFGWVLLGGILISLSELPSPPKAFSGNTPNTATTQYLWGGTQYRSRSIRREISRSSGTLRTYEVFDFTVEEASTPLAAGDSSGQVGTITFTIGVPDPEIVPNHPINMFGESILVGQRVRIEDSRKGFTIGEVSAVSRSSAQTISVSCVSRMGEVNVYGVQARPFVGNLGDAFEYYLGLAEISSAIFTDPSVANTPVQFPGWSGELWFNLKQMAASMDCDISLVSGVILLRPIRARVAARGRDLDRKTSSGGGTLAQFIEVYQYNNRAITNQLVYPPGGWSEDVSVINVNSGETVEEIIQLEASVSSVVQPTMQTFVSRDHSTSSVFTVVGDDGLPITPAAWSANGGNLRVSINPDTTTLTVTVTAPRGLPNKDGDEIGVYSISLSSDDSTGRYSTLRLLGSGVAFNKELKRIPTGITERETGTEVGITIDNPFLSTPQQVYRTALRAVGAYNGTAMTLSGRVSSVNQLGDSGELVLQTYAQVATLHAGRTYAQVQSAWGGLSYLDIQQQINAGNSGEFENQVFGNVAGARVWDKNSRRWYRIRSATLNPDFISFEADDDLTHSDVSPAFSGKTYAQVQTLFEDFNYRQVHALGVPNA